METTLKSSWVKEVFLPRYKNILNGIPERNRGDGFKVIFEFLEKRNLDFYYIVETGSMRPGGSLEGDGQSTRLFDEFVNYYNGNVISIELDPNAVLHATKNTSDKTLVFNYDSVSFLWNNPDLCFMNPYEKQAVNPCLFYLDSYDVDFKNPTLSNLHHMKEMAALSQWLTTDCLVAVDDCKFLTGDKRVPYGINPNDIGKGNFVADFMQNIGADQIFDGYQKVWVIR